MIKFDDKYFKDFVFTGEQVLKNFENAMKDIRIAHEDEIADVKFTYSYDALIKGGIALISRYNKKVKSVPGHHISFVSVARHPAVHEIILECRRRERASG